MCCGQSRAEYGAPDPAAYAPAAPAPGWTGGSPSTPVATAAGGVRLRFTEQARVRVRGPASGADYVVSGSDPVVTVAAADVEGLLRTGYFRRAY